MSGRPGRITNQEFAAYLEVEETNIDAVSPWQKRDRPGKRSRRRPARPPKQPSPVVPKKAGELINLERVQFTNHALDRLVERMAPRTVKDPEKTARKLLAGSVEEGAIDSVSRVKRLINNDFVDARYFVNSGWRFVLKPGDGEFIVLTIERVNK